VSATTENPPEGFLFLCPVQDLQPSPGSFQWPETPAYWSPDASGTERLSTEEATELGFPSIEFKMEVRGTSWDESVYAGLRTFHRAKGFDPATQEVARHLDLPLYQLSSDVEPLFAHCKHIRSFISNTHILTVDGDRAHDAGVNPANDNDNVRPEMVAAESGEPKYCIRNTV
jgi:hypothetical protein